MHDDKDIIERARNGEKEAFEMIIKRYQQPLFNYIGRMVRERELALDITQEVFVKTYTSLHLYQLQYKFSTWLFKIASNSVIDHWRKKKVYDSGDENSRLQVPDRELSVSRRFELSQLREKIDQALEKLPPLLREPFIWKHINEFSYEEIAEIKDLPVGTVKNRVFQAKEMIRRFLEEKE